MKVEKFVLGPLETNCYLICDEASFEEIVIDPADEGEFLSPKIPPPHLGENDKKYFEK